jgi:hypothetical protein
MPSLAKREQSLATEPSRETFVVHTSRTRGGQRVMSSKGPMIRLIQRTGLEKKNWRPIFPPFAQIILRGICIVHLMNGIVDSTFFFQKNLKNLKKSGKFEN